MLAYSKMGTRTGGGDWGRVVGGEFGAHILHAPVFFFKISVKGLKAHIRGPYLKP